MRTLAVSAILSVALSVAVGAAAWMAVGAWTAVPDAPPVVRLGGDSGVQPGVQPVAQREKGPEAFVEAAPPQPLPAFAFVDGQGRKVTIADFAGRVVLLNLWATWCAPCVKEMPSLDRLQALLGGERFQVVALSVDRGGRETVAPFLDKLGVRNLPLYLDPGNASMGALRPRGLPTTLLIDERGREVARLEGAAAWDSPEMLEHLRRYGVGRGVAPGGRGGGVVNTGG